MEDEVTEEIARLLVSAAIACTQWRTNVGARAASMFDEGAAGEDVDLDNTTAVMQAFSAVSAVCADGGMSDSDAAMDELFRLERFLTNA